MTRDCHRLTAIIANHQSAQTIDTHELLRLVEWMTPPIHTDRRYDWAENVAMPVIAELARRLVRVQSQQQVETPALLAKMRQMRTAQKKAAVSSIKERLELRSVASQLEADVDRILSDELQPSLFGDAATHPTEEYRP